jgi:hypothetical protein
MDFWKSDAIFTDATAMPAAATPAPIASLLTSRRRRMALPASLSNWWPAPASMPRNRKIRSWEATIAPPGVTEVLLGGRPFAG